MCKQIIFVLSGLWLFAACSTDPETVSTSLYYCPDPQAAQCNASVEGAEHWIDLRFERAGSADVEGPFCRVIMTGRIGNDLSVTISRDRDRQSTAFTNNRRSERVDSGGEIADLTCVPEGADVFVKVCRYRSGGFWAQIFSELDACTSTYRVHLPDPDNEVAREWVRPQVQLDRITCFEPAILDVTLCYSWDDQLVIVNNPNEHAVRILLDTQNRRSGALDIDSIPPRVAGLVTADDVRAGDVMRVSAWAAVTGRTDANDTSEVADWTAEFVMSDAETLTADEAAIRRKFRLTAPAVGGSVCTFIGQWFGDAAQTVESVPEVSRFRCVNQTGVDAKVSLYAMKSVAGGYAVDYFAGDIYVSAGEIDDVVLESVLLDGRVYALTHRDTGWSAVTDDAALFSIDLATEQVEAISTDQLAEALP